MLGLVVTIEEGGVIFVGGPGDVTRWIAQAKVNIVE